MESHLERLIKTSFTFSSVTIVWKEEVVVLIPNARKVSTDQSKVYGTNVFNFFLPKANEKIMDTK